MLCSYWLSESKTSFDMNHGLSFNKKIEINQMINLLILVMNVAGAVNSDQGKSNSTFIMGHCKIFTREFDSSLFSQRPQLEIFKDCYF